jgi:selenocysteine lyase/cysteine desulfurase
MSIFLTAKAVVFVTHMEHHSNQTTWLETIAKKAEIINPDPEGLVDLDHLRSSWKSIGMKNKDSFNNFCSNVTGIFTPYHEIAELIHEYGDGVLQI